MTKVALRRHLQPREETGRSDLQVLSVYRDHGVVPKDSRTDNFNRTPEDLTRYQRVIPDDLVVNKMKAWSGSVAVSRYEGIVSGDYLVCEVTGLTPGYLHYLLRSQEFVGEMRNRSTGIRPSQERLYWEDLAEIIVDAPPEGEQQRIADFLDDRVGRIDRIIAARAKQAEATEALGRLEVEQILAPAEVKRLVRVRDVVSKVGSGKTPRGGADVYQDDGVIFLRSQNVRDEGLDLGDVAYISDETDKDMAGTRVHTGDVLLNITGGSLGRCCVAPAGLPAANVSQHVCIVRPSAISPTLMAAVLRSTGIRDQITMAQVGGNREGLNFEQVRALSFWAGDEAADEGAIRESETRTLERVRHLERSIKLLTEYKSSLITAAVTGEIDVTASGSRVPA